MAERKVNQVADSTQQYRFVGSHADTLANGRPVEPGEFVELTDEDLKEPQNATLLDDGLLMLIGEQGAQPQEVATDAAKELARQHKIDLRGAR
jgi:RNA 3'-terminal phosphate cyclase